MASVELKNVSRVFRSKQGADVYALTHFDLQVADGEFVVLVGPSGCGKTTTLRLIAGLDRPMAGSISIGGVVVDEVPPAGRDVAMVFQRDALYPHMTAFENMAFGLQLRGASREEIDKRIKTLAAVLGISGMLDRLPHELSGGQRQRVALGRAAVRNPKVLLLDEPLSNLDAPMRAQLRREIARLHRETNTTMIHVTHDQAEAMALGQRIAVLKEGELQQFADAQTLYERPANLFVAGFIGSPPMNLLRGRVESTSEGFVFRENNPGGASRSLLEVPLPVSRGTRLRSFAEGNVVLGIRPEHIALKDGGDSVWKGVIESVESLGAETLVTFNTGAHTFVARIASTARVRAGDDASLRFNSDNLCFFNPASGTPIL